MDDQSLKDFGKTTLANYRIVVRGKLDGHWAEWLSDTAISMDYNSGSPPNTILTLQLRDQSELLGLLSRLHGFNLLILQVILIGNEGGNYVASGQV